MTLLGNKSNGSICVWREPGPTADCKGAESKAEAVLPCKGEAVP